MNKKFTFNASFRLGDDHLDGVDRGVVDLDVVLLERHAVHLASGARDGGPAGGGEGLALGHVREGHRALDDVVLDDVGQRLVRHEVNLGGAELLGELDEGVVVGAEDGDQCQEGRGNAVGPLCADTLRTRRTGMRARTQTVLLWLRLVGVCACAPAEEAEHRQAIRRPSRTVQHSLRLRAPRRF